MNLVSSNEPRRYEGVENRVQLVGLLLSIAFALLCAGFWQLQVLSLGKFSELAEENRVRTQRIGSDRGLIFGRNDVVLADNRASADIIFVPGECPKEQHEDVAALLERLLGVSASLVTTKIEAVRREPFKQIIIKRDVTKTERIRVEEHSYALPGVTTVAHPQRRYLYGKTGGQLLGYLSEINQEQLDTWENYAMGDLVGQAGLEKAYEEQLHGKDGYMLVTKYASGMPQLRTDRYGVPYIAELDSLGQILSEEGRRRAPVPGSPLRLTLDIGLQAKCEETLGSEVGAIVVLEADTGGVLAMASTPVYDPSVFVTRSRKDERLALLNATEPKAMKSRAYFEHYPPGSVFKVLLAAAALQEGVINEQTSYFCPGKFQIGGQGRPWHCWKRSGHGRVSVVEALAFSCDCFFYNVGLNLGVDKISEWSNRLGLGVRTGIDLPSELTGLVPNRAWKEEKFKDKDVWDRKWYPGDTVNLSIGQGDCVATPLQCAVLMASIVNGGYRPRPYLNAELGPAMSERYLSEATVEIVRKGMRLCVEKGPPAPTGTGHAAYIKGMDIMGKTGSAQVMSLKHHDQFATEEDIPYRWRDHAWFVAGVSDREPRIAVCILVEHGHHGSSSAAPLAKGIIEYFYGQEVKDSEVKLAQQGEDS